MQFLSSFCIWNFFICLIMEWLSISHCWHCSYVDNKKDHWYPQPMIIFKELEELNKVRIAVWLTHKMNHQDMGEKWSRRALLVEEMVKIFKELDIQYRLYPIDINIHAMPTMPSMHPMNSYSLSSNRTTTSSWEARQSEKIETKYKEPHLVYCIILYM